jgi:hypothetical protein
MTPWFTDPPVRIGVYQRDHYGTIEYAYWNGTSWNFGAKTIRDAMLFSTESRFQNLPWRGLREHELRQTTNKSHEI